MVRKRSDIDFSKLPDKITDPVKIRARLPIWQIYSLFDKGSVAAKKIPPVWVYLAVSKSHYEDWHKKDPENVIFEHDLEIPDRNYHYMVQYYSVVSHPLKMRLNKKVELLYESFPVCGLCLQTFYVRTSNGMNSYGIGGDNAISNWWRAKPYHPSEDRPNTCGYCRKAGPVNLDTSTTNID